MIVTLVRHLPRLPATQPRKIRHGQESPDGAIIESNDYRSVHILIGPAQNLKYGLSWTKKLIELLQYEDIVHGF